MKSIFVLLIGTLVFATLMLLGLKYANGKWKVPESKKGAYLSFTNTYGKAIKKGIIIASIIYGFSLLIQISKMF